MSIIVAFFLRGFDAGGKNIGYEAVSIIRVVSDSKLVSQNVNKTVDFNGIFAVASYIWLVVVLVLLFIRAVGYLRFQKLMKSEICVAHRFSRPKLTVAKSECILSPFLFGIAKPVVIIPKDGLRGDELRIALKHELAHYRRRDVHFKVLAELLGIVNFFNPAFYLLKRNFGEVCELVVDSTITEKLSMQKRKEYRQLLLRLAESKNRTHDFCFGLSAEGKLLLERMRIIMNDKQKNGKIITTAVTMMIATVALGLVGCVTLAVKRSVSPVAETSGIEQKPVSGFSLLSETGSRLLDDFASDKDGFYGRLRKYSVSGENDGQTYRFDKLAYRNGEAIIFDDEGGNGYELSDNQTVTLSIVPDYSPSYNCETDKGEATVIGYILDGVMTDIENETGRIPESGLELTFTTEEAGIYRFYAINACAGMQNYESVEIRIE